MKKSFIIYFFILLSIIVLTTLYLIEIPSPSTIILEQFTLDLK